MIWPAELHVVPRGDLIEHETDGDECACGPAVVFVDPDTGETLEAPVIVHASLDGRELAE
jgi:hypothetical protein